MKISKAAASNARRIFRMCLTHERLDEDKLRQATLKLTSYKPRNYRAVLHALKRLTRLELARRHVIVESAERLDPGTRERIATGLTEKYGRDLTYEYRVRPELLGGLKVRVGSNVWDGSVKGRLDRLEAAF
jgi:F-type H+-transporting ATPase subunit delta